MNENVEKLKKRTKSDMIISFVVSALALIGMVVQFVNYFSEGRVEPGYFKNGMYGIAIVVVTLILGFVLLDVRKNGTPFTKRVINLLRSLAVIVMITGLLPEMFTPIIDEARTGTIHFDIFSGSNVIIIIIGVCIGIISEIFVYGYELQKDNDSIA